MGMATGRINRLQVQRRSEFGLYLGLEGQEPVLLPRRHVTPSLPSAPGDWLDVFIYHDSEDRLVATTETPRIQVGEFANLKVVDVNRAGVFLDWGLAKDLLLPHSEIQRPLKVGDDCVVHAFLDARRGRVTASARLDRYLDRTPARYRTGEAVDLLLAEATDMGFKAIINQRHWGLLHRNELFRPVRVGQRLGGYVREVRSDGRISLSLQPPGPGAARSLAGQILARLAESGGELMLSDKSPPALISREFGVSKGNFKKAIGALYKDGRIVILEDRITLPPA